MKEKNINSKRDSVKNSWNITEYITCDKKKIPDERISPDIKSEQNSLNKKKNRCFVSQSMLSNIQEQFR